jgi:hypothetical protein
VGSHRRSPAGRIVHGSNAIWLAHRSPVPVLVAGFRPIEAPRPVAAPTTAYVEPVASCLSSIPRTLGELVGGTDPRAFEV